MCWKRVSRCAFFIACFLVVCSVLANAQSNPSALNTLLCQFGFEQCELTKLSVAESVTVATKRPELVSWSRRTIDPLSPEDRKWVKDEAARIAALKNFGSAEKAALQKSIRARLSPTTPSASIDSRANELEFAVLASSIWGDRDILSIPASNVRMKGLGWPTYIDCQNHKTPITDLTVIPTENGFRITFNVIGGRFEPTDHISVSGAYADMLSALSNNDRFGASKPVSRSMAFDFALAPAMRYRVQIDGAGTYFDGYFRTPCGSLCAINSNDDDKLNHARQLIEELERIMAPSPEISSAARSADDVASQSRTPLPPGGCVYY